MPNEPALRVLYAEDSPTSAELVRQSLTRVPPGMAVTVAPNCALTRQYLTTGTFDVLLADYYLPDGDGLALLELVRELALPIAVVIVTSTGNETLAVSALKAGVDDYIARDDDYIARLPAVLTGAYQRFQSHRVARERPIRVLYVEPSAHDIDLTRHHLLRYAPHLVLETVPNGAACLARLQTDTFDVLLTDYALPGTNGLDLLKEVNERGVLLPVVLVARRGNEELAVAALRLGAADYLVKHEGYLLRLTPTIEHVVARFRLERERAERQQTEARLRESQAQLVHAEKLAAVGQLISGVAHELNNPLAGIIGYAQLLRETTLPQSAKADIAMIEVQADRARRIISNLLTFARRRPAERTGVNINELVQRTLELRAHNVYEHQITVVTALAPQIPFTVADPYQIQQVVLNLLLNAEQALSDANWRTDAQRPARITVATTHASDPTEEIIIQVSDNGPGIAPQLQRRIFEPFFTTRPVGSGTGLGLAVAYGIVQSHTGRIWVESQLGEGTTVQVALPVTSLLSGDLPAPEPAMPSARPRVLVVDDETTITDLLQRALERNGMDVDVTHSGRAALERLEGTAYNVVICDVRLPDLSGQHLFSYLTQTQSHIAQRLILITGDITNNATSAFIEQSGCRALAKPFDLHQMLKLVQEVIAQ